MNLALDDLRSDALDCVQPDDGGAGIETTFAVTALLMVLFFVVGGMRVLGTNGDVASAARAGARAAAVERTPADAASAATNVVKSALTGRGVACAGGPTVTVSGGGAPGSTVTVTVSCVVALKDVTTSGFPGSHTVSAEAVEYVDTIRGTG